MILFKDANLKLIDDMAYSNLDLSYIQVLSSFTKY